MNQDMIYPWQQMDWQRLLKQSDMLAHAWLFYGNKYIGKSVFVMAYAKALLCENSQGAMRSACGHCQSCLLFAVGNHPDLYVIDDQENEQITQHQAMINIESVREVIEKVQLSSQLSGFKVVFIHPVEAMSIQAANALLKELEEPVSQTIFLLLSHRKESVLPTIVSRCRSFMLLPPKEEAVCDYLQHTMGIERDSARRKLFFSSGAPIASKHFPQALYDAFVQCMLQPKLLGILDFAQRYALEKQPLIYFFDWIYKWLADMILCLEEHGVRFNVYVQKEMHHLVQGLKLSHVWALLDQSNKVAYYQQTALNARLQIESILLAYLLLSLEKDSL